MCLTIHPGTSSLLYDFPPVSGMPGIQPVNNNDSTPSIISPKPCLSHYYLNSVVRNGFKYPILIASCKDSTSSDFQKISRTKHLHIRLILKPNEKDDRKTMGIQETSRRQLLGSSFIHIVYHQWLCNESWFRKNEMQSSPGGSVCSSVH